MARDKLSKSKIKTKLTKTSSPHEVTEELDIVKTVKTYPRSYRWREADLELIERIIAKVNSISTRKIDATKVIRGSLFIAEKKSPHKLIEAIMEAEKKSLISKVK